MDDATPVGDFVTTQEAAALLGFTVQHTRLLIRQGRLEARKVGRDWFVLRRSAEALRAANGGGGPLAARGTDA